MQNGTSNLKVINTSESAFKPSVVMLLYGEGGVGKTTFTATAPKPLLADCENGAKYFGLRGIKMDVAQITQWSDMKEFYKVAREGGYETVVIDPIGELMAKLKHSMVSRGDRKNVQADGSPTMAGWGFLKTTMRDYIKLLKNSGLHVIFVAHVDEKGDEDRLVKRPYLETKLSTELINMVDIVGYMTTATDNEGESKRVIMVDPTSDKFIAKDRTGQLGKIIEPNFDKIIKACQGTENYDWSAKQAVKKETPVEEEITEEEPAEDKIAKKAPANKASAKAPTKKTKKEEPAEEEAPEIEYEGPEEEPTEQNVEVNVLECVDCEAIITKAIKDYSEKTFGRALCFKCQKANKDFNNK